MFCQKCGCPTPDGCTICDRCANQNGGFVTDYGGNIGNTPNQSGNPPYGFYGAPPYMQTESASKNKSGKSKTPIIITLIIFAVLAAAVAVVMLLSGRISDNSDHKLHGKYSSAELSAINEKAITAHKDWLDKMLDSLKDSTDAEYRFAMADIDGDGICELAVDHVSGASSSLYMQVWKYEPSSGEDVKYAKFEHGSEFYRGNYVKSPHMTNDADSSAVRPYDVVKYDRKSKKYKLFASAYSKEASASSDSFDHSLDADGDGVIYYFVLRDESASPLTEAQYCEYRDRYIPEKKRINMTWQPLTDENAAAYNPENGETAATASSAADTAPTTTTTTAAPTTTTTTAAPTTITTSAASSEVAHCAPENMRAGMRGTVSFDTPAHAGINMRDLPSSSSELVIKLDEGSHVVLLSDYDASSGGYIFVYYVDPVDGVFYNGWVLAKYIV